MKIGIFILIAYIGLCLFIFFYQKNLIFFPSKQVSEIPKHMNIEEVFFQTKDNVKLHAWYLDNKANKTVLFFHGNAGNLSDRKQQLEIFNTLNLNALIFDYRGYGKSNGTITNETDLYLDANAALEYLQKEKKIPLPEIIAWGRSLGGAIAIDTTQNRKVFAVIIESTFFSMDAMARKRFWYVPTKQLSKFHFRSDNKIKKIDSKLLIIHSRDDEMIPFINGKKLFNIAPKNKTFLEISGSHNNGFQESQNIYINTLKEFLKNEN